MTKAVHVWLTELWEYTVDHPFELGLYGETEWKPRIQHIISTVLCWVCLLAVFGLLMWAAPSPGDGIYDNI